MRSFLFLFILSLTMSLLNPVSADGFYKWKDARGNIQYGDEPPTHSGAKKMQLPAITILKGYGKQWETPELPKTAQQKSRITPQAIPSAQEKTLPIIYSKLTFIAPKEGQVIQAKDGDVSTMLSIKPPLKLKQGHRIHFVLDQDQSSTSISRFANFKNLSNGTHHLTVSIVNAQGKLLQKGKTMRFSVQR